MDSSEIHNLFGLDNRFCDGRGCVAVSAAIDGFDLLPNTCTVWLCHCFIMIHPCHRLVQYSGIRRQRIFPDKRSTALSFRNPDRLWARNTIPSGHYNRPNLRHRHGLVQPVVGVSPFSHWSSSLRLIVEAATVGSGKSRGTHGRINKVREER